jgi:hypothetical protein
MKKLGCNINISIISTENKKTTFKLDSKDDFISKNIQYYIAGKISPVDYKILQ